MISRLLRWFSLFLLGGLIVLCLSNPILSQAVPTEEFPSHSPREQEMQGEESLLETAKKTGDVWTQSRILSSLALAYQSSGQWAKAEQFSQESLDVLSPLPDSALKLRAMAQALNNQGLVQLAQGRANLALTTWQQAERYYSQIPDPRGRLLSRINQVKALQNLGLNPQACQILVRELELIPLVCNIPRIETQEIRKSQQEILARRLTQLSQPPLPIDLEAWQTLGEVLGSNGQVNLSQWLLEQLLNLEINEQNKGRIWLFLGKIAQIQNDPSTALNWYQQAEKITSDPTRKIQIQLEQLHLYIEQQQWDKAVSLVGPVAEKLKTLSGDQATIYAQINYVQNLISLKLAPVALPLPSWKELAELAQGALQQARSLDFPRGQTYALGVLGTIYQQTQQFQIAQELTEQALLIAQAINAPEIAYRWQWQMGRLLQAQGEQEKAIIAYSEAIKSTEAIKNDLVAANQNLQFSFQETIELIYRELVSLLLHTDRQGQVSQENLILARYIIESLQVAELNNFFQEACLSIKSQEIDTVDPQAAVIYPIILSDRLEIIVTFPDKSIAHYTSMVSDRELEDVLDRLRFHLVIRSRRDFFKPAQKVYEWLIKPLEEDLNKHQTETLIFVLDGALRNIPIASLYDGQKFLIEKYAIALTPSLQLLSPQALKTTDLSTLAAGVTQARERFAPLYYVQEELSIIENKLPSKILLDEDFTQETLQKSFLSQNFPIVHIATHAQFSSELEETFILTWDSQLNILQLEELLKGKDIELLVLSACETARGDKRATLGLAGVAVRSGAKSTLATLWSVNDEASAALMNYFYQALASKAVTKAEALRQAQLELLRQPQFQHPFYWSAYVLLGNWL